MVRQAPPVNSDIWYIRWNDIRVGITSQNGTPFVTNGTAAETYGFESQFQAKLPFNLALFGQYTYTEAHLTELAPNVIGTYYGTFNAYPGDRLPSSPRQMAGVRLRYTLNLPKGYAFYATYGVTAQSNFLTSIGDDDASGEKIGGYAVHSSASSSPCIFELEMSPRIVVTLLTTSLMAFASRPTEALQPNPMRVGMRPVLGWSSWSSFRESSSAAKDEAVARLRCH